MESLAHLHVHRGVILVCVFLSLKRLDVPIPVLIHIIDNPGFLCLAFRRDPLALANRHDEISHARSMLHYVAKNPAVKKNTDSARKKL
jgi:hypothetical protein